jgi:hypothetical protein
MRRGEKIKKWKIRNFFGFGLAGGKDGFIGH